MIDETNPWDSVLLISIHLPCALSPAGIDRMRQSFENSPLRSLTSAPVVILEEGAKIALHTKDEIAKLILSSMSPNEIRRLVGLPEIESGGTGEGQESILP